MHRRGPPTRGYPPMQMLAMALATLMACAVAPFSVLGQDRLAKRFSASAWQTGARFRRQLEAPVTLNWSQNPLRRALTSLSHSRQIAFFLDRRVDPSQKVDLTVKEIPLDQALQMLAGRLGLGVCSLDSVVYVGPPATALKLPTISAIRKDEARRSMRSASPETLKRLAQRQPWRWEAISTPVELLKQLARSTRLEIVGLEQIPHDLWPEADLPPLSVVDRLTLVLAGFDLTFRYAHEAGKEASLRIEPFPKAATAERMYSVTGSAATWRTLLAKRFSEARIQPAGRQLLINASWEDHAKLARFVQGSPRARSRTVTTTVTYDLAIEDQPVGPLIRQLAARFQWETRFDLAANDYLQKRVSFAVKKATPEQIIKAAANAGGLTCRIQGDVVEVAVKDPR